MEHRHELGIEPPAGYTWGMSETTNPLYAAAYARALNTVAAMRLDPVTRESAATEYATRWASSLDRPEPSIWITRRYGI